MASPSIRGFARRPMQRQRLVHMLIAIIDGTGTAAIDSGGSEMTLVDNSTGDYTLTFGTAYQRLLNVQVTPETADVICRVKAKSVSAVTIECLDATDGTTAKDAVFHLLVVGSDAADEV